MMSPINNHSLAYVDIVRNIEKWIQQVNQRTSPSVKKILVANKIDCLNSEREVTITEGCKMAELYGL